MEETLEFPALLRLIDERSTAFRAAIAAAPDLDAQVPTCPEWTLFDLAQHLGEGRRAWAATVAEGPGASARSAPEGPAAPREREALLDWLAASAQHLLDALREAGPDRGCWTWWGASQSPQTCAAVARHQLQEVAVHTYDAQLAAGVPQPLPAEVALDGAEDFLLTCVATTSPWPHKPATVDFHAAEGRSWRLSLSAEGARTTRVTDATPSDASARGTAADLVMVLYGRAALHSLELDGDPHVFALLAAWEPED
ncbi:maleylpyruvate isomerase family mycothiol-dependent enzyme [Streptomyces sp. NPDC093094]|uniref:maleylpyruvate isomerase family mycothiol-dependent enzyme n=1 Tax=Streptomyces sp. NPDC093094 TaxID=3366026 RepID=UPI0038278463